MDTKKINATFQLLASKIESIEFKNDFISLPLDVEIDKNYDVSYEINDIAVDGKANDIIGTITLNVLAEVNADKNSMVCEIKIQGGFVSEGTQDVEAFKEILELNGCATLYSIARALILNISSQACIGAHILLPMINVFKLKQAQDEAK